MAARHPHSRQIWFLIGAIMALDQATKALVRTRLSLYETVPVIPDVFSLTRVHNTGAAFGMLDAVHFPLKRVLLAAVGIAALVALISYAATLDARQHLSRIGLALISGGAAGNLIDRITAGYVLDFVDVYWGTWHFWTFNVADAAITVGVALMLIEILGRRQAHAG